MKRPTRWTLSLALAAALGFGAAQALAAPSAADAGAQRCDPVRCNERCQKSGSNLIGRCLGDICQCYVTPL